ncbi:MAG: hypothetical protein II977_08700, partial [Oscillospiraceae bacterium]|nr:hypothetical protein [Oscillospiraceae bacterium]
KKANSKELLNKLRVAIPDLSGESISYVKGDEFPKSNVSIVEQVGQFFKSLGNKVSRVGFGDIIINERTVKDDIAHGIGRAKSATFKAVPDILAKGKQIDYQPNWKGRGYDSYVFAGQIDYAGKPAYVATVVTKGDDNRFYLHEVLDENGNIIFTKKETGLIKTGVTAQSGVTGEPVSNKIISHPTQDMQDADTTQVKNGKLVPEKWRREQPAKENNIQDKAQQVIVKAKSKAQKQLLRKKLTDSGKSDVVKQLEAFEKRTGINVWFYNGELEDMGGFAYKGEMFLDISDPDILLTTAIHESIHLYKNNNIDKFNKLRDRIFRLEEDQKSEYGEIGFWTRDAYTEIYGDDTDAINEEVVAKLCEICVNNPEQFFDTLGKEKNIVEIIADILREIKNTITIKLTNSEQAKIDNALIALERYLRGDAVQHAPVNNDIRFSMKEPMRRDVANMSWEDYNNYGWAILGRKDDGDYLLTAKDAAVFREAVRKMKPYANRNAEGNQMVIVDNKIITTNGDKNNPSYEQIIVFEGATSDTVADMEVSFNEAGKYLDIQTARESIRDAFPDANVTYYDKESFNTPRKFQGNSENRSGSGKAFKTVRKVQRPKSNGRINSGTLTGYISEDLDDYMSEDGLPRVTLSDDKDYIIQQGYNGGYVSFLGETELPTIKAVVEEMNKFIEDPDSVDTRSFIYDGENFISPSLKVKRASIPEEYQGMSTQEITKALIEKHGAHKKGEKITNEVSVPKKDMQGRNVAKGSQTIMEAAATKKEMLDDYQKAIAAGAFSYDVNRDKDAVDKAVKYIEDNGFRNTLDYWKSKISNDEALTKDDMAKAQIMYAVAVANDDYDTAMELAVDIINLY